MSEAYLVNGIFFFLFAMLFIVPLLVRWNARGKQKEKSQEIGNDATDDADNSDTTLRWQGTINGIEWSAVQHQDREYSRENDTHRYRWHWWAPIRRGPASPVLILDAKGKMLQSIEALTIKPKNEVLGRVADPKQNGLVGKLLGRLLDFGLDKVIDKMFDKEVGAQVDAATLKQVKNVNIAGYAVMAAEASSAVRALTPEIRELIATLPANMTSSFDASERPTILLLSKSLHFAQSEQLDASLLEQYSSIGASLADKFQ